MYSPLRLDCWLDLFARFGHASSRYRAGDDNWAACSPGVGAGRRAGTRGCLWSWIRYRTKSRYSGLLVVLDQAQDEVQVLRAARGPGSCAGRRAGTRGCLWYWIRRRMKSRKSSSGHEALELLLSLKILVEYKVDTGQNGEISPNIPGYLGLAAASRGYNRI